MENTYTFTARNQQNPKEVITFTLDRKYLKIQPLTLTDTIQEIAQSENRVEEGKKQLKSLVEPAALTFFSGMVKPIHVGDVEIQFHNDNKHPFNVTAWKRLGGLRLAPVRIEMSNIDNPEAAQAFQNELEERQNQYPRPGFFAGPLDYWLGWLAAVLISLFYFRMKKRDE